MRRPEVVRALSAAAAEGDRSENAEYTYRKKQLGEIDRRVRYLSKRLEALRVVDTAPSDPQAVFFGARVELENLDSGETHLYRIVGPDELDLRQGLISIDSPLARALVGKALDAAVSRYNQFVGSLESQVLTQARRFEQLNIDTGARQIESVPVVETNTRPLTKLVAPQDVAAE